MRVDADSEVSFEDLAWSRDGNADQNLITLSRGEVQVQARGGAETRVDTDNASLYLRDTGSYRIETRDYTTLLIVREGSAEVRTRRGATAVRADEEAWIEGDRSPEVQAAGTGDRLERWAAEARRPVPPRALGRRLRRLLARLRLDAHGRPRQLGDAERPARLAAAGGSLTSGATMTKTGVYWPAWRATT